MKVVSLMTSRDYSPLNVARERWFVKLNVHFRCPSRPTFSCHIFYPPPPTFKQPMSGWAIKPRRTEAHNFIVNKLVNTIALKKTTTRTLGIAVSQWLLSFWRKKQCDALTGWEPLVLNSLRRWIWKSVFEQIIRIQNAVKIHRRSLRW